MNAVRLNNVSLKYKRFTSSGCKDIRITKIEFVAKTQFLSFDKYVPKHLIKTDSEKVPTQIHDFELQLCAQTQ